MRRRSKSTPFCYDDKPTVGDLYLVPQLYNSRLFGIDLSIYPLLCEIDERCRALPAFDKAMPENQPDFPGELDGWR
jgi:glutathione S-transferase